MEVINPEHIVTTLDQIGGNARVKRDLVRLHIIALVLFAHAPRIMSSHGQAEHNDMTPNKMGGIQGLSHAWTAALDMKDFWILQSTLSACFPVNNFGLIFWWKCVLSRAVLTGHLWSTML